MSQEQFQAIMPIICADLVATICRERKVSEQDAIRLLYASRLYAALEDEQTKLWQYSTPMLCTLLNQQPNLAAELYQIDRFSLLNFLSDGRFPGFLMTLDNLVFLTNALFMHNPEITAMTPPELLASIDDCARKR